MKKQSLFPLIGNLALLFLQLFSDGHFHLHYIYPDFFFTLGTKEREIKHYRISVYPSSSFGIANWTANPSGIISTFMHKITSNSAFCSALYRLAY